MKVNPEETFIRARGLDPAEWLATRISVRESTSAKGEVSSGTNATLLRRPGSGVAPKLAKVLRDFARRTPRARKGRTRQDLLLELHLNDWHVGAREAADLLSTRIALRELLDRAKVLRPGVALIVLNGDMMHVDSIRGETTRGTRLEDMVGTYEEVFAATLGGVLMAIRMAATLVRYVDVLVVPGNHDYHAGFAVGAALEQAFADNDNVTIDNSTEKFRYYRHGVTLLGFAHGDTGKLRDLPLLMASDRPLAWADTTWHEWHTGHVHRQAQLELGTVRVRCMPALMGRSAWARNQGFPLAQRGVEAYLWDNHRGYVGHLFQGL